MCKCFLLISRAELNINLKLIIMKTNSTGLKIKSIVLITGLMILSSCSKKTAPTPTENLLGTWNIEPTTFTMTVGTVPIMEWLTNVKGMSQVDANSLYSAINTSVQQFFTGTIQFNSDNTFSTTIQGIGTNTGTFALTIDGKTLTLSANGASETFDLLMLTSSKLQFHKVVAGSEDLNNDGIPDSYSMDCLLTLIK